MEIKVRTYDEVSSERVKIEVAPGQRVEISVDGSLSMSPVQAANVLNQAERAGKVPALEARIRELEADRDRVREQERAASQRAAQWDLDRHTEQRRADQLKVDLDLSRARTKTLEEALTESRALVDQRDKALNQAADDLATSRSFRAQEREEARQLVARLADKLVMIRGLLYREGLDDYLDGHGEIARVFRDHDELARVIRGLRDVLNDKVEIPESGAEKIGELERQLDRVRAAVRGSSLDQATVEYVNHEDFKVRHMARRLRRIRTAVAVPEPITEPGADAEFLA